jgi:hypothetical protein
MKISVLIPTYKDPHALLTSVFNLVGMAKHTDRDSLEIIAIASQPDPLLSDYATIEKDLCDLGLGFKLVVSEKTGYDNVNAFYQAGYRQSSGRIILLYNDDVHCLTLEWDEAYRSVLGPMPYGVACATVDESPNPSAYPWAFSAIKREVCEALGERVFICTPANSFDRVIPAYSALSGRGVRVSVKYRHEFKLDNDAGGGRVAWLKYCQDSGNWEKLLVAWEQDAAEVHAAVRAHMNKK